MAKSKYSFLKTLKKVAKNLVLILTPVLLSVTPEVYLDMTLGGALAILADYAKHK